MSPPDDGFFEMCIMKRELPVGARKRMQVSLPAKGAFAGGISDCLPIGVGQPPGMGSGEGRLRAALRLTM